MVEETEKRIRLTDNSFEAQGVKFVIYSSVNIERYMHFQELQVRAAYGSTYAHFYQGYQKIVDLKNKGKGFEADIALHNMMQGASRALNKQHDSLMLICTLFCCPSDEDRTIWNEESANEKIALWSKEGYPVEDFLALALQSCKRYQDDLFSDLVNGSEAEQAEK
jgi:hypothetical protein